MQVNQAIYKKLSVQIVKLRNRYLFSIAVKSIFDEFNKITTFSKVGKKKAKENTEIINSYKYFFLTTKEAARCFLMIELAKFFDDDQRNQVLSIWNVISYAEKNIQSFSLKEFHQYHDNKYTDTVVISGFSAITKFDLDKIKRRLKNSKSRIENLKTYRDKFLAHDDINKKDVLIKKKDVDVLLKIVKDTIDLFYLKLEFTGNDYSNYEESPIREIRLLLELLKEARNARYKKFSTEYGIIK